MSEPLETSSDILRYEGQAWGTVPISALSAEVGAGARLVYVSLWLHVSNLQGPYTAWPGRQRLADMLGITVTSVSRHITTLVQAGYLKRQYRIHVEPGWRGNPAARIYDLVLPEAVQFEKRSDTNDTAQRGSYRNVTSAVTLMSPWQLHNAPQEQTQEQTQEQDKEILLLKSVGIKGKPLKELAELPANRISEVIKSAQEKGHTAGWVVKALREGWNIQGKSSGEKTSEDRREQFRKTDEYLEGYYGNDES